MSEVNGQNTSSGSAWTIEPSNSFEQIKEGVHPAVVLNVSEPFEVEDKFSDTEGKMKKVFNITFGATEMLTNSGDPMTIRKRYTASTHPKSTFSKDLNGILGRPLSPEESRSFSPVSIEGEACQIIVEHSPRNDGQGVWANVSKVMKAAA